jgi:hypothetical protein
MKPARTFSCFVTRLTKISLSILAFFVAQIVSAQAPKGPAKLALEVPSAPVVGKQAKVALEFPFALKFKFRATESGARPLIDDVLFSLFRSVEDFIGGACTDFVTSKPFYDFYLRSSLTLLWPAVFWIL